MSTHAVSPCDDHTMCPDVGPSLPDPALADVTPPLRFAMVEKGVFRGAYPVLRNFPFLRGLGLRTILSLTPEEPTYDLSCFADAENITLRHIRVGRYKGEVQLLPTDMNEALQLLINAERHPLYVHCLDGRHVVGLVIMGLRKLQLWEVSCSHLEYQRFTRNIQEEVAFIADYSGPIVVPKQIPSWLWKGSLCDTSGKPKRLNVGIHLKFPSSFRYTDSTESGGKGLVRGREGENSFCANRGLGDVSMESVAAAPRSTDITTTSPMHTVTVASDAHGGTEGSTAYVDLLSIAPAQLVGTASGMRQTACIIHTERPITADVRFFSLRTSAENVLGPPRGRDVFEALSATGGSSQSGGGVVAGSFSLPVAPPSDVTAVSRTIAQRRTSIATGATLWGPDGEANGPVPSAPLHQQLRYVVAEVAGHNPSTEVSGNTKKMKRRNSW